jgi:hypothetical protein
MTFLLIKMLAIERERRVNELTASAYSALAVIHGVLAHIPGTHERHLEASIVCLIACLYYIFLCGRN